MLPVLAILDFTGGSDSKESAYNVGDLGLIPGLGRSPGEGKGYSLQYSGLENSMNCTVHGVTKSRTQLNNFHFRGLWLGEKELISKVLIKMLGYQVSAPNMPLAISGIQSRDTSSGGTLKKLP